MSDDGAPALRRSTRKYMRLFAFVMISPMWVFQFRLFDIVRPRILAFWTTVKFLSLTTNDSKWCLNFLKSITIGYEKCVFYLSMSAARLGSRDEMIIKYIMNFSTVLRQLSIFKTFHSWNDIFTFRFPIISKRIYVHSGMPNFVHIQSTYDDIISSWVGTEQGFYLYKVVNCISLSHQSRRVCFPHKLRSWLLYLSKLY